MSISLSSSFALSRFWISRVDSLVGSKISRSSAVPGRIMLGVGSQQWYQSHPWRLKIGIYEWIHSEKSGFYGKFFIFDIFHY